MPRTFAPAALALIALLISATVGGAQQVARTLPPRQSARVEDMHADHVTPMVSPAARPAFRVMPVLVGAVAGALLGGVGTYVLSKGGCENTVPACHPSRSGRQGALVGAGIGASIGLVIELASWRSSELDAHGMTSRVSFRSRR